jgi:hypothetical protein
MKQAAKNAKEQEDAIKELKQKEKDYEAAKIQRLQHVEQERKRAELALKNAKSVAEYNIPSIKTDKPSSSRKKIDYGRIDRVKETASTEKLSTKEKRPNRAPTIIKHRVHHPKKGGNGELVALNTSKRDLRTVEEIQLEMKKETAASKYHDEIRKKREEALRKKHRKIEEETKQIEHENLKKADYKEQRDRDREEMERRKMQVIEQKARMYSSRDVKEFRGIGEKGKIRREKEEDIRREKEEEIRREKEEVKREKEEEIKREKEEDIKRKGDKTRQTRELTPEKYGDEKYYAKNYSSIIADIFGYDRNKRYADDDIDDMEADLDTIQREERQR